MPLMFLKACRSDDLGVEERRRGFISFATLALVLPLTACGSSEAAPKSKAGTAPAASATYAVAGLSTGMTSEQVKVAALRAGYRLKDEETGPDWKLALEEARNGQSFGFGKEFRGLREHRFAKGGEAITVTYIPLPQGPVAISIYYSAPPAIVSFEQARAELVRRYGKSSFRSVAANPWAQWCARPAANARECLKSRYLSFSDSKAGLSLVTADETLRTEQKRLLQKAGGARASF